jgi:cytochrome c
MRARNLRAYVCAALAAASFVARAPARGADERTPGLWARFYFVGRPMEQLPVLVANQTPNVSVVVPVLDLAGEEGKPAALLGEIETTFLARVEGFLTVAKRGKYGLRLTSDDGSRLALDGRTVIDHDGLHSATPRSVDLELAAGEHPLAIDMFQTYGGWALKLEWKTPGTETWSVVPESALSSPRGEMRITSPGVKKVLLPLEKGAPGDGLPLESVHPSYDLMTVRPPDLEPRVGGMDWLPDGKLVISTWDAMGCVYLLDGVQGTDRAKITAKRIACGLAEPLGVACVGRRIFVLQKQELTELIDLDGDLAIDEYHCLSSAWNVSANFHEFAFGLVYKDGWFYATLAIAIDPGGRSTKPQIEGRGSAIRIRLVDGKVEFLAHGLRTPNGIGLGTDGEIFFCDNQGDWLPSSKLLRLETGAFYGSRSVLGDAAAKLAVTPPVLWLPQNEIGNSPSTPALIPPGHGPYSGQMCHADVTQGGVQRDFIEKIDGVYQGCVFRWTQGLEAGVNRLTFGPDGALYVGGIGSTGDWGQAGKQRFGLQRLKYNAKPVFEPLALRAKSDGFELEFTEPLAPGSGWERESYVVQQWRYAPTEAYGGPKIDERRLEVRAVSVSADRRKVDLWIDGLAPDHVVYLHLAGGIESESGRAPWTTETWYTLNRIPKDAVRDPARAPQAPVALRNVLTAEERAAGWRLLFDGTTTNGWRGYKAQDCPSGWRAENGALVRAAQAGDIVTTDEFGDFELVLDWKIARGGNSGVFFRVDESHGSVWESGAEMQVLDNDEHVDGRNPLTSAGSNYALHAPPRDVTRPAGAWNRARLVVRGAHVEHWLNGVKVVEYELWTDEWKALVAASKFAGMPAYALAQRGRIALQDHGDRVEFRDVKLRELGAR